MPRFRQTPQILKLMNKKERIRNIGIIAHIDHGKTTMTDSLLIEAGLLPAQFAGSVRALDYLEEEQRRGITIKTANVSLLHKMGECTYLINLVDTPGHVDFAGKVTRALRAIDGVVVVVDSVEEIMAQTETVTRQALQERVRPVLFINKVDRLITEMELSPNEIQGKFNRIIDDFNNLINTYGEPEFRKQWKVAPTRGSVAFGSALHKWGFALRTIPEKGWKFTDIVDAYRKNKYEELFRKAPLHNAILDMVAKDVPNPAEAQKYRVPKIWKGDLNSEIGRSMLNCDDGGPAVVCLTAAQIVPNIGLIATGRVFSGSVKAGESVYLLEADKEQEVRKVSIYMSAFREVADRIPAGNIAALGLDFARAGETVVDANFKDLMVPFEPVRYVSEHVMTVAIEPKEVSALPKLIEVGNRLCIEDPNITIEVDKDTGQYLLSGVGELQLEIALKFLRDCGKGMELNSSDPIVAYRESILAKGKVVMAKCLNRQNLFWVQVEPVTSETLALIEKEKPTEGNRQIQPETFLNERATYLLEKSGKMWTTDMHRNLLVDFVKDENLKDVRDSIVLGFHWACKSGPLCQEPLRGVEVRLVDALLNEDPAQRESVQISRAISRAILGSCLTAKPILLEPIYKIEISTPTEFFGACASIIKRRHGKIEHTYKRGNLTTIAGYLPVREAFGLSAEIRSSTSGRAFWQLTFDRWDMTSKKVAAELIKQIRIRRGLPTDIPKPDKFVDKIET